MALVNETGRLRDLDREFLRRYDMLGPRYTSYPTAPEWNDSIGPREFADHLRAIKNDWQGRPLSIYVHLPFCVEHCLFCACNVIISTKMREVSDPYLAHLEREIEMHAALNAPARPVTQFHWGGGTPTYLDCEQIERLHGMIASRFNLAPDCETSIEVHPPVTTDEQIRALAALGFNRLSMGVQDFNEATQRAINRIQTYERTGEITELARSLGFTGINYDLVYGLPHQTEETFGESMEKVLTLSPDRLALYNFAFLPDRLAHQRAIDPATLPSPETKLRIFLQAHDRFIEAGYRYIGMDHFAKPTDELAIALEAGALHRNFMGFTTRAGADMVSMGVSSISSVDRVYAQNVKKLTRYAEMIGAGQLPVERGLRLSDDDAIRRRVIGDLMCRGGVSKSEIGAEFGVDFDAYFAEEWDRLAPLAADELLTLGPDSIELTFLGRLLSRNAAMIFDAYLARERAGKRPTFSRTL